MNHISAGLAVREGGHGAHILLGIVISLTGSTVTNIGLILQKYSLLKHDEAFARDDDSELKCEDSLDSIVKLSSPNKSNFGSKKRRRVFCPSCLWFFGVSVYISGQILGSLSLGLAPQTILGALGPFALVSNSILAPLVLGEVLTWRHVLSSFLIILGSIVIVYSRPPDPNFAVAKSNSTSKTKGISRSSSEGDRLYYDQNEHSSDVDGMKMTSQMSAKKLEYLFTAPPFLVLVVCYLCVGVFLYLLGLAEEHLERNGYEHVEVVDEDGYEQDNDGYEQENQNGQHVDTAVNAVESNSSCVIRKSSPGKKDSEIPLLGGKTESTSSSCSSTVVKTLSGSPWSPEEFDPDSTTSRLDRQISIGGSPHNRGCTLVHQFDSLIASHELSLMNVSSASIGNNNRANTGRSPQHGKATTQHSGSTKASCRKEATMGAAARDAGIDNIMINNVMAEGAQTVKNNITEGAHTNTMAACEQNTNSSMSKQQSFATGFQTAPWYVKWIIRWMPAYAFQKVSDKDRTHSLRKELNQKRLDLADPNPVIRFCAKLRILKSPYRLLFTGSFLGALGVTGSKAAIEWLLGDSFGHTKADIIRALLILLPFVISGLLDVALINIAVFRFGALLSVPTYFGFATVQQSLIGYIFFQECAFYFDNPSISRFHGVLLILGFLAGMIMNLSGLKTLMGTPHDTKGSRLTSN